MRLARHVQVRGCRTDRVGAQAGMLAACSPSAQRGDAAIVYHRQQAPGTVLPVAVSGADKFHYMLEYVESGLSAAPMSRQGGCTSIPAERSHAPWWQ